MSPRTGRGWSVGREQLWILRGFESVNAMIVTSKIRFLLISSDSIFLFTFWVCRCKLHNWLVHCPCYYCQMLSELHLFRVGKQYTAIHERFCHVSHPSLKRVVSPDSALFFMSRLKRAIRWLNGFLLPWLRGRFFLQVAASLVMMFFVENYHRETPLHRGRLHLSCLGFFQISSFVLASQIVVILGNDMCTASL